MIVAIVRFSLAAAMAASLTACTESRDTPADVSTDDVFVPVEVHILQALLSDGLDQAGVCAPGIFLAVRYGIRNDSGADIRLCSAAVHLYQQPEDTRLVCLVHETQIQDETATAGMSEHSILFDVTGQPTFECYIPFDFSVSPRCGEMMLDVVCVPASSDCTAGPRQTLTHLGSFDCLTEELCQ
jgi:hypothetical protein